MAIRFLTILLSTFFLTSFVHAQEHVVVRSDWKKFFSDLQAEGAIVIADERQAKHTLSVFDQERAAKRYSPASTFKIPHTLFALDADAVRDEFQVFRWDGVNRSFAGHNQDQDLRSAMRNSTVWVYELFAKDIGEDKARRYLKQIDYGNVDPS
ncbi:penicillin-binding transpeptidase domain-containing protein, partial [Desulfuromonas thiophila]|uniref:penicillin-binding transpeptidase domain-containing protein n=1 Tax=Desulfuromonas thiophila TaxID=57664 RepID=UPI0024A7FFD6